MEEKKNNKTTYFAVRVTEEELETLKKKAAKAGLSVSAYARARLIYTDEERR